MTVENSDYSTIFEFYEEHASELAEIYDAALASDVHRAWLEWLPEQKGLVLDVGAGSGRDASWLASMGFNVHAVEPVDGFRVIAQSQYGKDRIEWINDRLPELRKLNESDQYDLILVSAVWMHLAESARVLAFVRLAGLLKQGGRLVIVLRHGPSPEGRSMYQISQQEVFQMAKNQELVLRASGIEEDYQGRAGVSFSYTVMEQLAR